MLVFQCDICGKAIPLHAGTRVEHRSTYDSFSFCDDCGVFVVSFLKEHQLLTDWPCENTQKKESVGVE